MGDVPATLEQVLWMCLFGAITLFLVGITVLGVMNLFIGG